MKVFLTGGAGFIGSNMAQMLLNKGFEVISIDNFDDFYDRSIKEENLAELNKSSKFKNIEGDIRDSGLIMDLFKEHNFDLVVHLAAKAGVRPSLEQPALYYDVNLNGTVNILEAMKATGVKKMAFASSSSVYGNNKKVPFSEKDAVDHPISPYAASKKAGELLCHTYHHLHGFDISCLRFFTVYGPKQRPEMAIHNFVRKVDEGEAITMFGDGSSERDYTYIEDITQGIMASIDNLGGYKIYNLGESNTISLADLITEIEKALSKKAIINQLPMQPGDVNRTFADISIAKEEIGYSPTTPIKEGIPKFVAWYNSRKA